MKSLFKLLFVLSFFLLPQLSFASYSASSLLGQADFTSGSANRGGSASEVTFSNPRYVELDKIHHHLFVSDLSNQRVLVFNLTEDDALIDTTADYVLGQNSFSTVASGTAANKLANPQQLAYDSVNDRLFVADGGNSRILVFDLSHGITNGMNAVNVIGQSNFTTSTANAAVGSTNDHGFSTAPGVAYDQVRKRLFAADFNNRRVLVFDLSSGITDGMSASYVLGQADFVSSTSATTQAGMGKGDAVTIDVTNNILYVADSSINNRILVYNLSGGITTGMNATYVIGQDDFTSASSTADVDTQTQPKQAVLDSANNQLFVISNTNARILAFNIASGFSNGMDASNVLGQDDFTTTTAGTTQTKLAGPWGGVFDAEHNRLWVGDPGAHRVISYDFPIITAAVPTSIPQGREFTQTFTSNAQGTATYSVTGTVPTGTTTSSTGVSGTVNTPGQYTWTISATDAISTGNFYSLPLAVSTVVTPLTSSGGGGGGRSRPSTTVTETSTTNTNTTVVTPGLEIPKAVYKFYVNLKKGMNHPDVKELQKYLNANGIVIAATGAGSPGNETTYFGNATLAAVKRFQEKYRAEILTPLNLTQPTGMVGEFTRKKING